MKNSGSNLFLRFFPGIALCAVISAISFGFQFIGQKYFGHLFPEALVIAILLGVICRSLSSSANLFAFKRFNEGIGFTTRYLLEFAIVLLGASISTKIIVQSGISIVAGVVIIVFCSILISFFIARSMKLPPKLSLLLACGNSICGNSAIAAVAPVINAKSEDVTPAIAFTAVLGIAAVLCMPYLIPVFGLSDHQYGVFAGLTVYAVPQVLAATAPVSVLAVQTGTIVKLLRVLMLGPVIFIIGLLHGHNTGNKLGFSRMLPWFIIGFMLLLMLRSLGLIPQFMLEPIKLVTTVLTNLSMAALGLGVDIKALARSGGRVIFAAFLSLLALGTMALTFIHFFILT